MQLPKAFFDIRATMPRHTPEDFTFQILNKTEDPEGVYYIVQQ